MLNGVGKHVLSHVRRELNSEADSLANVAMDARKSSRTFTCPGSRPEWSGGAGRGGQQMARGVDVEEVRDLAVRSAVVR